MRRVLLVLSLFGILFVTSCGGRPAIPVKDAQGRTVGAVQLENAENATILSANKEVRGRVRGDVVRADTGGKAGGVEQRDGHTVLLDAKGNEVGSVENGTDCYGKSQKMLGTVAVKDRAEAAGAACLLLLLPKE